jgi:hypothetical protein
MATQIETGKSIDTIDIVEGDIVSAGDTEIAISERRAPERRAYLVYVYLPIIFLTAALLGGLRFSAADRSFIFLKPSLVCLIFAAMLMILISRAHLISLGKWFSEENSLLSNMASGVTLASLYIASTQIFNSLIPEEGLPYWLIVFCFFWTLWNNIFAEFDTRRLVRSLGALFALAFVVKYLVLLNLAAPANQTWLETLTQNPSRSAATWLLDIPQFSPATGYLQFFAVALYMLGLYLLPSHPDSSY